MPAVSTFMKRLVCLAALIGIDSAKAQSQIVQCSRDSQGNQVCVGTQPDRNICGNSGPLPFGGQPHPYYCNDVFVRKTAPDGRMIYSRVLAGASEDLPRQFFFDAQDNVVLLGTTWSSDFPTTADAVQRAYAGPSPSIPYGASLWSGGDLFLSVLTAAGDLLYSTFLGSSGSDAILGIRAAPDGRFDALVNAGAANFPVLPEAAMPSAGPVLLS